MSEAAQPLAGDEASATVTLAVAPEDAFAIFTGEIDLWWRQGVRFRHAPGGKKGIIRLEPGVGGRVFEAYDAGDGERAIEMGRMKVWEPPHRLLFEWRNANFAPAERTEVEVRFEATHSGTRVTVMHRGWSAIRLDHPARHALAAAEFIRMIAMWWGDQLTSLRLLATKPGNSA